MPKSLKRQRTTIAKVWREMRDNVVKQGGKYEKVLKALELALEGWYEYFLEDLAGELEIREVENSDVITEMARRFTQEPFDEFSTMWEQNDSKLCLEQEKVRASPNYGALLVMLKDDKKLEYLSRPAALFEKRNAQESKAEFVKVAKWFQKLAGLLEKYLREDFKATCDDERVDRSFMDFEDEFSIENILENWVQEEENEEEEEEENEEEEEEED